MTRSKGSPAVLLRPEDAGVVQAVFDANAGLSLRKLGGLVAAQLGLAACNEASLHRFVVAHGITREMPQHVVDRSARLKAKGVGLMHAELRPISPVKRTGGVTGSLPRAVAGSAQSVSPVRQTGRVTDRSRWDPAQDSVMRYETSPRLRRGLGAAPAADQAAGEPCGGRENHCPALAVIELASITSSSTTSLPLADQVDERPGTPASATAAWALGPLGLTGGVPPAPQARKGTRKGSK